MNLRRSFVEKTQWNRDEQYVWAMSGRILHRMNQANQTSRRPYGATGQTTLTTQDFILGYSRILPTGER